MANLIYVIDDDEGILEAFQAMLECHGYNVRTFPDAESILTRSDSLPDLIILDVLLSGVDGRDIAKKLKSQEHSKTIPIIMASAHPGVSASIKAAGADDFIAKPFEMNDLLAKVQTYIGVAK